jgi:hypothetical protein
MRWKPARAAESSKLGLASIGPVVPTAPGIARVSVPGSLQAGGGPARKVRGWSGCSGPASGRLAGGAKRKGTQCLKRQQLIAVIGIDIGRTRFTSSASMGVAQSRWGWGRVGCGGVARQHGGLSGAHHLSRQLAA